MLSITETSLIVNLASHDQFTWRAMAITCKHINDILSRYDMYDFIGGAILIRFPCWYQKMVYTTADRLFPRECMTPIRTLDILHDYKYIIVYNWAHIRSKCNVSLPHCELDKNICSCYKYHKVWTLNKYIHDYMVTMIDKQSDIRITAKYYHYVMHTCVIKQDDMSSYADDYRKCMSYLPYDNYIADIIGREHVPI